VLEPYLVVCGLLLLGSVLARALPAARRSLDEDYEDGWDLTARELAYLKRGPYGVVLTVLAALHAEGAVDLSDPGPVRRLDPPRDLEDSLVIAVYSGLHWSRRPRLLALAPRVRRACAALRGDLRERRLLPPLRRRVFAAVLLLYAVGLAAATTVEDDGRGSTVVGAAAVCLAVTVLALGPRRTLAGGRELAMHAAAMARVAGGLGRERQRASRGPGDATDSAVAVYLGDLVAADGLAAIRVLCGRYVACGALAPPLPSYEPVRVVEPVVEPIPLTAPLRLVVPSQSSDDGGESIFVPAEPPVPVEAPALWRREPVAVAA
jgi:uncharacterized protein (TIGR04222 family)